MLVQTTLVSVDDLGFPKGALTREILGSEVDVTLFGNSAPFTGGRGSQLGLDLCPAELGPSLRLQYKDQPLGDRIYVAMRPIPDSAGVPRIFVIAHDDGGKSLDAVPARSDDFWDASDKFVFRIRS